MQLNASVRWRLRFQHLLFLLLFALLIGLLAWLSNRYSFRADWTVGGRNTLSQSSRELLSRLSKPIHITAYAREIPTLRDGVTRLIQRYQSVKPDLTFTFINPDVLPDRVRALGVTRDGELYVEYGDRAEKIQQLSEQALTTALQRLSRHHHGAVLFLEGHGERKPLGVANHDLGTFGRELEKIGITVRSIDLSNTSAIPVETAALVIAGPQRLLAPSEIQQILDFVTAGGSLLWLLEPNDPSGLQPLAALLGIAQLPGTVVDPGSSRLGIKNPAFIPIIDYGLHPITQSLQVPALLPQAVALELAPKADWNAATLLESQSEAWTETGPLDNAVHFDLDTAERRGPLLVGVALVRAKAIALAIGGAEHGGIPQTTRQRLAIIGDGDFLSNTYLGNGANLELGINLFNWLLSDETPLVIRPKAVPDPNLNLSAGALAFIAALFLLVIPSSLLASGWLIWLRRRRR
ncbi:MAG: GldG family protein [Candidatus Competibacteraceae bacterium]|nr:GldG family protein [Candidatus Competibacteraceae bacterium]